MSKTDETLREGNGNARKFRPPSGQDAYYPPASRSPRRQLEAQEVAKNPPRCKECSTILEGTEPCSKPGCRLSRICVECKGTKDVGKMFCDSCGDYC